MPENQKTYSTFKLWLLLWYKSNFILLLNNMTILNISQSNRNLQSKCFKKKWEECQVNLFFSYTKATKKTTQTCNRLTWFQWFLLSCFWSIFSTASWAHVPFAFWEENPKQTFFFLNQKKTLHTSYSPLKTNITPWKSHGFAKKKWCFSPFFVISF